MTNQQSLVAWLVFHAQRERDLVRLAMAFKLQKPRWGSHATLVAAGVASYLEYIDWDLPEVETRFREWHALATQTHDRALLMLRSTQIKELADLVLRPRVVTTQARGVDEAHTPAAVLLPRLVNRGLLYRDVQILAREGPQSSLTGRMLPDLCTDDRLRSVYRARHPELRYVSEHEYVEAVGEGPLNEHPDVLLRDVLEHWNILAVIGSTEPALVPETIVPVPVGNRDRVDAAFVGKALDA